MDKKRLISASAVLIVATVGLTALRPEAPRETTMIPVSPAQASLEASTREAEAAREQARVGAETSRQEVPAILAARAEQERLVAEEAARQEQQRKVAAAAAAAEERRRAAEAAKPKPPTKPAAPAPAPDNSLADQGSDATRRCIMRKESGGNYSIVSKNGTYHGAYQFSRATGDATAKRMGRPDLVGVPVSRWTPAEQDQAFWTLWNHGAGRGNWPTAHGC